MRSYFKKQTMPLLFLHRRFRGFLTGRPGFSFRKSTRTKSCAAKSYLWKYKVFFVRFLAVALFLCSLRIHFMVSNMDHSRYRDIVPLSHATVQKGVSPPHILVLGMHHTGTSIVTKLLLEMGIPSGDRYGKDLLMLPGNPLKYNEYAPAVYLNKKIIKMGEGGYGPWWVGYGFRWERIPWHQRQEYTTQIQDIVRKISLDSSSSSSDRRSQLKTTSITTREKHEADEVWVMKDPRLCLLSNEYLPLIRNPVCIVVARSPVQVAHRMLGYNRPEGSLSAKEWAEMWEEYTVSAIRNCRENKAPIILVHYRDIATQPRKVARHLYTELSRVGIGNLTVLSHEDVGKMLGTDYVNKHLAIAGNDISTLVTTDILSPRAKQVWDALDRNRIDEIPDSLLQGSSWSKGGFEVHEQNQQGGRESSSFAVEQQSVVGSLRRGKEAYVTMISAEERGYIQGALVLAATIRQFDSERDLVALVTEEVPTSSFVLHELKTAGWLVQRVAKLEEPWFNKHPKCKAFNQGQVIRWGRMFSKLRLWSLIQYTKVVYLDTDTMVLKSIDDYFQLPNAFYAERSPLHTGINAGIMVVEPSESTLEAMMAYAREHEPLQFFKNNQVGCTEQELVNRFWNGADFTRKLNNTRHANYLSARFTTPVGREELRKKGARIAHWITSKYKCPKPWDTPLNSLDRLPSKCDPLMYKLWHAHYVSVKGVEAIPADSNSIRHQKMMKKSHPQGEYHSTLS